MVVLVLFEDNPTHQCFNRTKRANNHCLLSIPGALNFGRGSTLSGFKILFFNEPFLIALRKNAKSGLFKK